MGPTAKKSATSPCFARAGGTVKRLEPYHRYAGRLHAYCVGMVHDQHTAAELPKLREPGQAAAVAVCHRPPHRPAHSARTASRTRLRRAARRASVGPGPFTQTAQNELAALVMAAASGLRDRDRERSWRRWVSEPRLRQETPTTAAPRFERSLGALLVARRAAHNGCPNSPRLSPAGTVSSTF